MSMPMSGFYSYTIVNERHTKDYDKEAKHKEDKCWKSSEMVKIWSTLL